MHRFSFVLLIRKLEKAVAVSGVCLGVPEENSGKVPGKIAGKYFPNREMLQILGFQAGTFGPHCRDLVPTFLAGGFLKWTVPAFSSCSDLNPREGRTFQGSTRKIRNFARKTLLLGFFFSSHMFCVKGQAHATMKHALASHTHVALLVDYFKCLRPLIPWL